MRPRAVVLALLVAALPVLASHPQPDPSGATVSFQLKPGGNEWWVEVIVKGTATVSKVEVMDDGGPWAAMTHKPEWGSWAISYHVEPGHRVTFRATTPAGLVTSCPFTHPAGSEQCSTPPPPPPPSGFDASFGSVRGNEWWVQAQVTASGGILAKVEVTSDHGATWRPLARQSWGVNFWAASYHFPQGTVLQLRATSTTGATDVSACYAWIPPSGQDAATVQCGGSPSDKQWLTDSVDGFREFVHDMGIGDADRDGKTELYVASQEGLFRVTPAGRTLVSSLEFGHITVADGTNDGQHEIFGVHWSEARGRSEVHRLYWNGQAWADETIYVPPPGVSLGIVTVGDVDNDGRRELYLSATGGSNALVFQVSRGLLGWQGTQVADLGDDGKFLDIVSLWIGDGDRDGRLELAASVVGYGYGLAVLVEKEGGAWRVVRVGGFGGSPSDIVAGDVDGDGKGELVVGESGGILYIYRFVGGAWQESTAQLPNQGLVTDLFLGDGDNDGDQELYAGTYEGVLYQVFWAGGRWNTAVVRDTSEAQDLVGPLLIVVGDGDRDGRNEVYSTVFNLAVRMEFVVKSFYGDPFTATFTNVKGNEYWIEAVIRSNYDIHAVMVIFNCDTSRDPADMSYRADWGKWVLGGTRVPSGTKVVFWVHGSHGDTMSQGYIWPKATPTTGC